MEPWAYPNDIEPWKQLSAPTWQCPGGLCKCAAGHDPSLFEYAVLLCDENGAPIKAARCRVWHQDILLDDGQANADGWLLVELRHEPKTLLFEWAPADMPQRPPYPFRQRHHVSLDVNDTQECARRRIANLGFSAERSLTEQVRRFQERHAYDRITGRVEHIAEDLRRYHDLSRFPILPSGMPRASRHVHDDEDHDLEAEALPLGTVDDDHDPPRPGVPDAPQPPNPPSVGYAPTGGGIPAGRGTAVPLSVDTLLVRMRARFSLRADLSDIRLSDGGRHLPQLLKATVELHVPALNLVLSGRNSKSTSHRDGVVSRINLLPLQLILFQAPASPVAAKLVLRPEPSHALVRGDAYLRNPVGPTDGVPAGIDKGHMLFRPLIIDLTLDPATMRVLSAAVAPEMQFTLPANAPEILRRVSNGGVVRRGPDTLIVDWRPDYVQCHHDTVKVPEHNPYTGAPLGPVKFIHIHHTNSTTIGSAILRFSEGKVEASAHYLVDRDGFVVKMANENIRTLHTGGAAWYDLRSRGYGAGLPATIAAFNDISVGVEHVHPFRTSKDAPEPTHFEVAQMQASRHLVGRIAVAFGTSLHNVLGDGQTAVGDNHQLGRKVGCPGSGYDWSRLEFAALATPTRAFRPPAGHPYAETYQIFDDHFAAGNAAITASAPALVRGTLEALLRGLGYHMPLQPSFDAVLAAVGAFQVRHFGGPGRRIDLVQTPSHRAIVNRLTVDTVFGVLVERNGFTY